MTFIIKSLFEKFSNTINVSVKIPINKLKINTVIINLVSLVKTKLRQKKKYHKKTSELKSIIRNVFKHTYLI